MNKLILISGPTGVGKSSLAIELAKILNTEIISADSMQIYKGFNIGTAKVTEEEMQGIKHHMIDIVEANDNFSVKEYREMAYGIIDKLHAQNKIPIVVGGTGLYINSLIYNLNFDDNNADEDIRNILNNLLEERGIEYIRIILKHVDEESYNKLHLNDYKRNVRALEYFLCKNEKYSEKENQFRVDNGKYEWYLYALTRDRKDLYKDIDARVDEMVRDGLLDEFETLKKLGVKDDAQSMTAIGYKELVKYKNGVYDFDTAINLIKQHSRNYAKRQLTWFRNDEKAKFIDVGINDKEQTIKRILEDINVKH
ncbi:tRNA (adenosine(37)-N6)-dimethylallyltransferase MiaA [Ezakiella peruensis]|uniref:tRNA (adenosine(37)-N6)-dimethylallyltransferase MiaA n=1 Tax=Ezakiella peruensis TaxID=1464038 RepID=UPI001FE42D3F|nr:tRNA (adenosine(37)-N6)-dimethylallyltransferase MiaA [Ezakiella peruensis]